MKSSVVSAILFTALASAAPPAMLEKRQGKTSNELAQGKCADVALIMARGSTEGGNMGTIVGSGLCAAMKAMGDVACQGVGGAYKATLAANTQPKGTDAGSIKEATSVIMDAMTKCPNSKMVLAGYSQGSAVISQAYQGMPDAMQAKVKAVAFYGYTKNQQTNGMLPDFPQDNLKVFCRKDDGVCGGQLQVTAGHLAYQNDGTVDDGAKFLMNKAQA